SVAYAPDEIILTLSIAGIAAARYSPWIGAGMALVIVAVVASYRQTVREYPSGGGDYEVASTNLGARAGVVVAASAFADYALTVAVSLSCAAQYVAAVAGWVRGHQTLAALIAVGVLAVVAVRWQGHGRIRAVIVYAFMAVVGATVLIGLAQGAFGCLGLAPSAAFQVVPEADAGLVGLGGAFLVMRAFSAGSVALTGVETIASSVPAFRPPRGRNAAATLTVMAVASITLMLSVLLLAQLTDVRYVADPATSLRVGDNPIAAGFAQAPVIAQIAQTVLHSPWAYTPVILLTSLMLVTAGTTSFGAVPALAARLAQDGYLPKQLYRRGDRRVAAHSVVALAVAAGVLVWVFDANVTRLIQLYIVGVFGSMTVSHMGMIRHWNAALRLARTQAARRRVAFARAITLIGVSLTAIGLIVVLLTKFGYGAWVTVLLVAVGYVAMTAVRRHYDDVASEMAVADAAERTLPPRVHGMVLVSQLHRAALRAIAYARATRPSTLEVVSVRISQEETDELRATWEADAIPVPLTVLDSPSRDVTRPLVAYVKAVRRSSPRELVVVFIPEYIVSHWWQRAAHNRSAARLTRALRRMPGVVIASVPWQLGHAPEDQRDRDRGAAT
ncbi:MAG: APC family permease, partial [Bifidobacteriaceae bacterium]|nr:APC family permease [Bifidobacteriaceae bacterium]